MVLLKHELKTEMKSLLLWTLCAGFTCFGCILLFGGLKESMEEMAEAYSQMGSFSAALGMDKISVSTMEGFYATEVALIFAIGGAMFAAMTGASMLSKEEEGHTAEFLYTLPLGRGYVVWWKYLSVAALIFAFNVTGILWELAGFAIAGEMPDGKNYILFHGAQLLMHLEMGSICFLISACSRKKQTGAALGLAVLFYVADLMCRIVPDIERIKYVTPYYFSNAVDIFTEGEIERTMPGISAVVIVAAFGMAVWVFERKDL